VQTCYSWNQINELKSKPTRLAKILNHQQVARLLTRNSSPTPAVRPWNNIGLFTRFIFFFLGLCSWEVNLSLLWTQFTHVNMLTCVNLLQPMNRTQFYIIYDNKEVSRWETMIHVYFNHQRQEIPEISLGKPMKSVTICVLNDFGQEVAGEGHLHIGWRFCVMNTKTTDTVPTLRATGD